MNSKDTHADGPWAVKPDTMFGLAYRIYSANGYIEDVREAVREAEDA